VAENRQRKTGNEPTAEKADMSRNVNEITQGIIGAAMAVHKELGPGLLESAYEACMAFELAERGLSFERQKELPLTYRGVRIDCAYRIDFLVEEHVVVELKAVEKLEPIHEAQLLSYLKLSGCEVGLLINFNVKVLKNGIRRRVCGLQEPGIQAREGSRK
jgi:GxxExxY protein